MKQVTLQIDVKVPNNCQINDRDDILQLLVDFPYKVIYIDGKVI